MAAAAAVLKRKSKVEIHVSCNKLKKKDKTSKSDPCCVLYVHKDGDWVEEGRTETIQNNHDPQFTRHFELEYEFDETQDVRFEVYDIDNKTEQLGDDDFLGQVQTTLEQIVSGSPLTLPLLMKQKVSPAGGTITFRAEEMTGNQEIIQLTFKATKLDNKDRLGKSDPFLEFFRKTTGDTWESVYKTEVVKDNLNPTWRPIQVKTHVLCAGNHDCELRVDCRDYDSSTKSELIGSFTTSVAELIRHSSGHEWPCINEAKVGKKNYENSGVVSLVSAELLKT